MTRDEKLAVAGIAVVGVLLAVKKRAAAASAPRGKVVIGPVRVTPGEGDMQVSDTDAAAAVAAAYVRERIALDLDAMAPTRAVSDAEAANLKRIIQAQIAPADAGEAAFLLSLVEAAQAAAA